MTTVTTQSIRYQRSSPSSSFYNNSSFTFERRPIQFEQRAQRRMAARLQQIWTARYLKRFGNRGNRSVSKKISRMMQRWNGKVAIVTGASAGIGASVARLLVKESIKVVGLARRKDKLDELAAQFGENQFYPVECDLRKEDDVVLAFNWIEERFGGADILVNNAAVADQSRIIETTAEDYKRVLETNVVSPAVCAREFVQSIKKRNGAGHMININSMAGHYAETIELPIGMYAASKYALNALSTELRHEIKEAGLNIKVTSISPGAVLTDMLKNIVRLQDVLDKIPSLNSVDVANAVMYALGTPPGVEIYDLFLMPQNSAVGTAQLKKSLAEASEKK